MTEDGERLPLPVHPASGYTGVQVVTQREVDRVDQDETQRLLRVVLGRLEELSAEFKGMKHEIAELSGAVAKLQGDVTKLQGDVTKLQGDVTKRFDAVDARLEWLASKTMDHDEAIFQLKRKQA